MNFSLILFLNEFALEKEYIVVENKNNVYFTRRVAVGNG